MCVRVSVCEGESLCVCSRCLLERLYACEVEVCMFLCESEGGCERWCV